MDAIKELIGQLAENVKKAPGWLPLLFLCYITASFVPEHTLIIGNALKSQKEITISVITLLLYVLGDAFDRPAFRRLEPVWLESYRLKAERALSLKDGIYKVSMSFAIATKRYERSWIRVKNESAKFFRSLVLPALVIGIVLPFRHHFALGAVILLAAIAFLGSYVWLKARHMADLYELVESYSHDDRYEAYDLTETKARLFFWDGELIASSRRPRTLVLLHGFPFDRSMWRPQIDAFRKQGYRVIAPNLISANENGFGESLTMTDLAKQTAAFIEEERVESAVVCSLSMGCYVAFELYRLFPSRVQALVLCGPRAQGPDEAEKKSREAQAVRVLMEGMGFAVESISKNLLAKATVNNKPDVVARVTEMVLHTDPHGAAAAERGMAARRDYSRDLPNIKVPTLIIAGREDGVRTPADAEFIHRGIEGSKLAVIENAGHLMNMEQPEAFNQALLGFLQGLSR